MKVYDKVIKDTIDILKDYEYTELKINKNVKWNCLKNNEFLLEREVAFELGHRINPCTVYNCLTSNDKLINQDRILLYGKDLDEIKENSNFSRITFMNVDNVQDPNKAYIEIKRLEYERFKLIPEGYMILSSSLKNRENVRVSKKAIKARINFEIIGNLFINHYKKIGGVNNVWMIFIVGDYPYIENLVNKSYEVDAITNAFDHILKNVIVDCKVCPLNIICEDVEALRELHFGIKK
ncbi:MAG: hypothetical protein N4A63_09025 [Vallitalea sp.]|jgi:CO dehydrogenase/acetyl-CoA synthase beta subunit|nr:hypothetical protein [Vallitalea sp.]